MLKRFHLHFLLLILFFLLHGYSEYVGLIPVSDLFIFFIAAAAVGLLVFFLFKKILRSSLKAGILTTLVFLFYLFYGSIRDVLKPGLLSPLSRYTILLPAMLAITIALGYYLKKSKKEFPRLTLFINCLLLLYLLIDIATIVFASTGKKPNAVATTNASFVKCDTCHTPDIYLIVMDAYAGQRTLYEHFGYSNKSFADALQSRGFFVPPAPSSNYSATPVAIASLFSMNYMPEFHRVLTVEDYTRSEKVVNNSLVLQLLKAHGYSFVNHSIFDLDGQPGRFKTDLLPMRLQLITEKTLWNSVYKDLEWQLHVRVAPKVKWVGKILQDDYGAGNERLLQLTLATAAEKATHPRFVYTHVLMPHWPYLYDSTGKESGINFYSKDISIIQKEAAYIQYLAYTNKRMLEVVDHIMKQSGGQAVIVLVSDHGYREWQGKDDTFANRNDNFSSVYIPGRNYRLFYDSISNVNLFRSLFSTMLHQQLAPLPDKSIF